MTSRQSWKTVGLTLAPLLVLVASPAYADTLIDFENLPAGTAVSNQYPGVTFNGAGTTGAHISAGDVTAHAGSNVLINSPLADPNSGGPLTVTFNPPQQTVTLWAGYVMFPGAPTTVPGTLKAFDSSGALVPGAAVSGPVAGAMTNTPFTVSSLQANIASVTLDLGAGIYTVIDNLDFSGGAVITPPGAPVVSITAPLGGATVDATNSSLAVNGTVSGQQLMSNVQVTLQAQFVNAPNLTPPVFTTTLPLDSTQTSFGGPNAFSNLPIGIYKVTVTATNLAGQSGAASVTVNNLPSAVDLVPSEFQYFQVANGGECQFVAYNDTVSNRVLAFFPATSNVIPVDVPVFTKWQNVNNPIVLHGDGTLGCPVLGEIAHFETAAMVGSLAFAYEYKIAPFERGSIYWVSTAKETMTIPPIVYTPKVFSNAITNLSFYAEGSTPVPVNDDGGIDEVGIPVADPTFDLSDQDPTFIFQQFFRPWYVNRDALGNVVEKPGSRQVTPGLFNTLEIRGNAPNPTLYVERIGGSLLDFRAAFGTGSGFPRSTTCKGGPGTGICNVPVPGDPTPTIWESGGCNVNPTSQAFNCTLDHPHVQAFTSQTNTPIYTSTSAVPDDSGYCATSCATCLTIGVALQQSTEWSAIPEKSSPSTDTGVGDGVDIQSTGWVVASNAANTDVPATHEHIQGTAHASEVIGTGVGCLLGAVGCGLGAFTGYQLGGMFGLWSDYGIHIRPLARSGVPDPNAAWVLTPTSGTLPPLWNLLASNGDPTLEGTSAGPIGAMEMEWEEFWDHPFLTVPGVSQVTPIPIGSLVFANGRWIIDCSHTPVHSEIHPPNTVMYSVMAPVTPSQFAQNTVTAARMWVNEFYLGAPYQTQVWPPPRPTATAQMNVSLTPFPNSTTAPMTTNSDGSHTFAFAPSQSFPPPTSSVAAATVSQQDSGLVIEVAGPATEHGLKDTGQLLYPDDHPEDAGGPISNLYATWIVGWNCETINGQSDCQ